MKQNRTIAVTFLEVEESISDEELVMWLRGTIDNGDYDYLPENYYGNIMVGDFIEI